MTDSSSLAAPTSCGQPLDLAPASFGELRRSDDFIDQPDALRQRFQEDGYLYLPGFFPREQIGGVRLDLLRRLDAGGALQPGHPVADAVAGPEVADGLHRRILEDNASVRAVVFGSRLLGFYRALLGGEAAHFDHIWMRVVKPGRGTPPHADSVYMNRGTPNVFTAWIPYGDVTREIGGLMMLEQSHRQSGRIRHYLDGDVDTFCANRGPYKHKSGRLSNNPRTLRERLGGRWLTADFRLGDLLTFGMTTVHASLDNHSRFLRLSTDTRYQRADEAMDPRWVGPDTEEYSARHRIGKIC